MVPSYRKVSDKPLSLAGLPAREIISTISGVRDLSSQRLLSVRRWHILLLAKPEYWLLTFSGNDDAFQLGNSSHYEEVEQIVGAFKLSDRVLTRLRGEL